MKAHGGDSVQAEERRRQHVLPRVLLAMILAPASIHTTFDTLTDRQLPVHDVDDAAVFFFEHIHDVGIAERPGVVRLAAARRVERGLLEYDVPAIVRGDDARHAAGEVQSSGIGVVQAAHGSGLRG